MTHFRATDSCHTLSQFSTEVEASGNKKYMASLKQRLRELSASDDERFQEEGLRDFMEESEDVLPGEWHLRVGCTPKDPQTHPCFSSLAQFTHNGAPFGLLWRVV